MSLTPPDFKQCQADVPGNGPFTMGGEIGDPRNGYRVRCKNKPQWIATEASPGADGEVGSMSLCDECKEEFIKQLGPSYAYFSRIGHHPMQPIVLDEKGTPRFKGNGIIKYLFQTGKLDLNELSVLLSQGAFPREDYAQITQLLGYSVSGWGDLSTSPEELVAAADADAELLTSGAREKYLEQARGLCRDIGGSSLEMASDDVSIEVDDDARTSKSDGGCWVQGWIWVPEECIR